MAFPTPDRFKELIPNVNGSLCDKFVHGLDLPRAVHELVSSIITENAELTQEFIDAICAAGCAGDGTGGNGGNGGTTLQPPVAVMATDGDFSDKIRVTWPGASGATSYLVYRNTVNSSATASFLSEVVSTTYDDATAEIGVTYYYWIKSKNATEVSSNFSPSDSGFRAVVLDAISDLAASQGFNIGLSNESLRVRLVFSPSPGAEVYDFYRNTVEDFGTAQKIDEDRAPFDNSETLNTCPVLPCTQPTFIDNDGELVYWHPIQSTPITAKFTRYFFWVRARKVTMPAISEPSNAAMGWSVGFGSGAQPLSSEQLDSGLEVTVPSGVTQVHAVLFGGGAGGAGSNNAFGGGGAGGAATVWGTMAVAGGVGKFRVRSNPVSGLVGGDGAIGENGDDGYETFLEYTPDGNPINYVAVMTCNQPLGGQFNGGGGGAGGAGAGGSATIDIVDPVIHAGRDGKAASGTTGGRSGYRFGGYRLPPARFFPEDNPRPVTADFNRTGSGSDADLTGLGRGDGVDPLTGAAILCWRA